MTFGINLQLIPAGITMTAVPNMHTHYMPGTVLKTP
jgi:hypothetical protein